VLRPRHGIPEYLESLVHPRGPLERSAALGVAGVREAVGVDLGLDVAVGALERFSVQVKRRLQAEKFEDVLQRRAL
jgi:hypothetical protein